MYVEMEMRNCEDEDYAYGTERQKQLDAEWVKPARQRVVIGSALPDAEKIQRAVRRLSQEVDKLPWEDESWYVRDMSVAEKIGWIIIASLMAFGLLWGGVR
jgi:hypothetical protein